MIQKKINKIFLSLIFGLVGTFAFSPYNLWPLAFISVIGFLRNILNCRNIFFSSFLGFMWGIGLFGSGMHWIYVSLKCFYQFSTKINFIILMLLIFYLSIYPMVYAGMFSVPKIHQPKKLFFYAPTLWVSVDLFRGWILANFPWLEFGYSQIDSPLRSLAPIFGVRGITFFLVMICGLCVLFLMEKKIYFIFLASGIFLFSWLLCSIQWYKSNLGKKIEVVLVQGNIFPTIDFKTNRIQKILNLYLKKTLPFVGQVNIIVWPESAIPTKEHLLDDFLKSFDKELRKKNTVLITGIFTSDNNRFYNGMVVLGDRLSNSYPNIQRYHKHHLVPFGEKVPFRKLLEFFNLRYYLPKVFLSSGPYLQNSIFASKVKITPAICYEAILGEKIYFNFQYETDLILVISDNSWFKNSIGPLQYFQMIRMRSLELARPLLHGTNNGITAIINANGTLSSILPQFVCKNLRSFVIPTKGITPYARFGPYLMLFITIINFVFIFFKKIYKHVMYFKKK